MKFNKNTNKAIKGFVIIVVFMVAIGLFSLNIQDYNMAVVFRPMIRNVENRLVEHKTRDYTFVTTENFVIRYEKEIDLETVNLVAKTAEEKYKAAVEAFQYEPEEKILVIVYDDPEVLMKTTMLRKGTPPMGVYYGDTIHILNPAHWVEDKKRIEEKFYHEGPFLHELVHLFTEHIAKGNFPIWFTEGVSLYFEYKIDDYEWGKEVVFQENEYTIEELTNNFYGLNEYLAYTQSFRKVRGLVENHGMDTLMEIIRALGEGKNLQDYIHLF